MLRLQGGFGGSMPAGDEARQHKRVQLTSSNTIRCTGLKSPRLLLLFTGLSFLSVAMQNTVRGFSNSAKDCCPIYQSQDILIKDYVLQKCLAFVRML
jgi:hypothetical protein